MGSQLALIVIGKDREDSHRFIERDELHSLGHTLFFAPNSSRRPIARIANEYLDWLWSGSDCEIFGFCHADTTFCDGALETFRDTAAAGAVCGIVGRDLNGNYIWSNNVIRGTVEVSTLDCCSVFFRRDSGLRFDEETFDGFHCYVEDLCLQAHAKGIPVVVPPAKASHLEESTRNPEWQADYKIYRKRLAIKWAGTVFETT